MPHTFEACPCLVQRLQMLVYLREYADQPCRHRVRKRTRLPADKLPLESRATPNAVPMPGVAMPRIGWLRRRRCGGDGTHCSAFCSASCSVRKGIARLRVRAQRLDREHRGDAFDDVREAASRSGSHRSAELLDRHARARWSAQARGLRARGTRRHPPVDDQHEHDVTGADERLCERGRPRGSRRIPRWSRGRRTSE